MLKAICQRPTVPCPQLTNHEQSLKSSPFCFYISDNMLSNDEVYPCNSLFSVSGEFGYTLAGHVNLMCLGNSF